MDRNERILRLHQEWSFWRLAEYAVDLELLLKRIWNDYDQEGLPHVEEIQGRLQDLFEEGDFGDFNGYKDSDDQD